MRHGILCTILSKGLIVRLARLLPSFFSSVFLIIIVSPLSLSSCSGGGSGSSGGPGSISYKTAWVEGTTAGQTPPKSVVTVRAVITNPSAPSILKDFTTYLGIGMIADVPAGSGYTITLQGLNADYTVIYSGTVSGIQVSGGQTTDCGLVTMNPVSTGSDPSVPSGVTAVPDNGQTTVIWNAVIGASSYNLYWATGLPNANKINGTKIADVSSPYIHSGLANGTSCYYVVTAVIAGTESADSSPIASAMPSSSPAYGSAPTGVAAVASSGQVTIAWSSVSGANSYNLYWSTDPLQASKAGGTKIPGATSPFIHSGLTNGTTYYYVVTALTGTGESGESAPVVSATPAASTNSILPAPTGVTATSGNGQVTVTWNSVSIATSYNLYWSTDASLANKASGTKIANVVSPFVHSGLANGTSLSYTITAVKNGLESIESSPVAQAVPATAGTIMTVVSGLEAPGCIGLDGSTLLFSESVPGAGSIKTVSTAGGTVGQIALGLNEPWMISISGGEVFWGEHDGKAVKKAGTAGGAVTTLASGLSNPVYGIAADTTDVYWIGTGPNGSVNKVSRSGGDVTTLVSGLPGGYGLALDAASVYWADCAQGAINKVAKTGGAVTVLATTSGCPWGIAVDGNDVYWTEKSSGSVNKVGVNGGAVTKLASGMGSPYGIVLDGGNVYWTINDALGTVGKVSKSGGSATTLASGLNRPSVLAVDGISIYWIESGISSIRKTAK